MFDRVVVESKVGNLQIKYRVNLRADIKALLKHTFENAEVEYKHSREKGYEVYYFPEIPYHHNLRNCIIVRVYERILIHLYPLDMMKLYNTFKRLGKYKTKTCRDVDMGIPSVSWELYFYGTDASILQKGTKIITDDIIDPYYKKNVVNPTMIFEGEEFTDLTTVRENHLYKMNSEENLNEAWGIARYLSGMKRGGVPIVVLGSKVTKFDDPLLAAGVSTDFVEYSSPLAPAPAGAGGTSGPQGSNSEDIKVIEEMPSPPKREDSGSVEVKRTVDVSEAEALKRMFEAQERELNYLGMRGTTGESRDLDILLVATDSKNIGRVIKYISENKLYIPVVDINNLKYYVYKKLKLVKIGC